MNNSPVKSELYVALEMVDLTQFLPFTKFQRKMILLFLLAPQGELNDPKLLFAQIHNPAHSSWNYFLEMQDENEFDYVFEMLKQSYDLAKKN